MLDIVEQWKVVKSVHVLDIVEQWKVVKSVYVLDIVEQWKVVKSVHVLDIVEQWKWLKAHLLLDEHSGTLFFQVGLVSKVRKALIPSLSLSLILFSWVHPVSAKWSLVSFFPSNQVLCSGGVNIIISVLSYIRMFH